jgi:hypothetical protein
MMDGKNFLLMSLLFVISATLKFLKWMADMSQLEDQRGAMSNSQIIIVSKLTCFWVSLIGS